MLFVLDTVLRFLYVTGVFYYILEGKKTKEITDSIGSCSRPGELRDFSSLLFFHLTDVEVVLTKLKS